jgi:phosphodiesterase/alkaline phosphatase D-like protein
MMRIARSVPGSLAAALMTAGLLAAPAVAATPETPVTESATSVTATTAILHGELNPHSIGEPGGYQFYYRPSTEACRPGAEFIPEPPGAALGNEKEAVQVEATNLQPDQTYAFCLIADPESEFIEGPSITFTTLAMKPSVFAGTTKAVGVSPFGATLEAQVNPNNEETTYSFKYATNPALTGAKTLSGASPLAAEYGERTASVATGNVLTPSTTYYFRVIAANPTGTTEGPAEQFTTPARKAPKVIGESISGLNTSEPKLEAKINPEYEETSYEFEYATEESGGELKGTITTVNGAPPMSLLPAVSEELTAGPVGLSGLTAGPTYFYRVAATNATGTTFGIVHPFQVLAKPVVSINAATRATRTTVRVAGSVIPQGLASTYHFAYVSQEAYDPGAANPFAAGKATYEMPVESTGYTPQTVESTLEELQPGTTYVYTLIASNELGTSALGAVKGTFTTSSATPPIATTGSAEGVGQLGAKLTGGVNTRGLATEVYFEFGTTPGEGALLPAITEPSSGNTLIASLALNGLQPGTVYYYRVVASNRDGTSEDAADQSFTTSTFPAPLAVPTTPALVPFSSIAELNLREAKEASKPISGPLTRAQKLAKALAACKRRPMKQRAGCRRLARRRYGPNKR